MRSAEWRYVCYTSGEELLHDLRTGPGEIHDLSQDPAYAAQKPILRQALVAWLDADDAPPMAHR